MEMASLEVVDEESSPEILEVAGNRRFTFVRPSTGSSGYSYAHISDGSYDDEGTREAGAVVRKSKGPYGSVYHFARWSRPVDLTTYPPYTIEAPWIRAEIVDGVRVNPSRRTRKNPKASTRGHYIVEAWGGGELPVRTWTNFDTEAQAERFADQQRATARREGWAYTFRVRSAARKNPHRCESPRTRKNPSSIYGTIPSYDTFYTAWMNNVGGDDATFEVRLSASDSRAADGTNFGDGEYTLDEMYAFVEELVEAYNDGNEGAGDLASSVLQTVGIEWV